MKEQLSLKPSTAPGSFSIDGGWPLAAGLGLGLLGGFPQAASLHGGWAHVLLVGLLLLVLLVPAALAEWLLGRRAGRALPEGFALLTREADVARFWRLSGWLLLGLPLLSAGLLLALAADSALSVGLTVLGHIPGISAGDLRALPLLLVLAVLVTALLAWGQRRWLQGVLLALVLGLLSVSAVIGLMHQPRLITADFSGDWLGWASLSSAMVSAVALLALGQGAGFIAGTAAGTVATTAVPLRSTLLAGLLALAAQVLLWLATSWLMPDVMTSGNAFDWWARTLPVTLGHEGGAPTLLLLLALILLSVHAAQALLSSSWQHPGARPWRWLVALPSLALALGVVLSSTVQSLVLPVWGVLTLLSVLLLVLFAGWMMKMAHARKALGFARESHYLLWRVLVRVPLPLLLLLALLGQFWS